LRSRGDHCRVDLPVPEDLNGKFTYNGGEESPLTIKNLNMKVSGTFFLSGKMLGAMGSTSGECRKARHTASR
jgi:hypothetical protein